MIMYVTTTGSVRFMSIGLRGEEGERTYTCFINQSMKEERHIPH
jgi:hypothetical protein